MKKIELLAPARDLHSGMTAIVYGADAVYIGGMKFGARRAAANSAADIARLVDYARGYGVRVYAALNTVVFEDELAEAEAAARELIAAGVDALIIQDMAFMRMGLEGVEFHASTQTCNTTPEKVRFLQESGFSRIILERGLTLEQIKKIRGQTGIELECFVHGAICVGFSGQCYLSRSMGPRSGNRGDCAQPCRLGYDLLDEDGRPLITGKHLLSVQDMDFTERIPQLLDAGVTSFKIEGRLKETGYVKNIVAHYRREIDKALAAREGFVRASSGRSEAGFTPDPERTFTRGGSLWMLDGPKKGVASFDTPKAVGSYIGKVSAVYKDSFELKSGEGLSSGDGICFVSGGELKGTNINKVAGGRIFPNKPEGIVPGLKIYRNYDHAFSLALENSRTRRVVDISAEAVVRPDGITLQLTDNDGVSAGVSLGGNYAPAKNPGKMLEVIGTQIKKTGGTIFHIEQLHMDLVDGSVPFILASDINELRRQAVDALSAKRKEANAGKPKNPGAENIDFPYPAERIGSEGNVTNSLAAEFYRDHGVTVITPGSDLNDIYPGGQVMTSVYCLRRELGWCLKENPEYKGALFLRNGTHLYRLEFDCRECRMNLIKS